MRIERGHGNRLRRPGDPLAQGDQHSPATEKESEPIKPWENRGHVAAEEFMEAPPKNRAKFWNFLRQMAWNYFNCTFGIATYQLADSARRTFCDPVNLFGFSAGPHTSP